MSIYQSNMLREMLQGLRSEPARKAMAICGSLSRGPSKCWMVPGPAQERLSQANLQVLHFRAVLQHHYPVASRLEGRLRGSGGVQVASPTLETWVLLCLSLDEIGNVKLHSFF